MPRAYRGGLTSAPWRDWSTHGRPALFGCPPNQVASADVLPALPVPPTWSMNAPPPRLRAEQCLPNQLEKANILPSPPLASPLLSFDETTSTTGGRGDRNVR